MRGRSHYGLEVILIGFFYLTFQNVLFLYTALKNMVVTFAHLVTSRCYRLEASLIRPVCLPGEGENEQSVCPLILNATRDECGSVSLGGRKQNTLFSHDCHNSFMRRLFVLQSNM